MLARLADQPAAADAKHARSIHVPLLETDRASRAPPRRLRLWLRVRLAPHAGRLVFRGDTSADLVGVRTRRGAVEDLLRGRRGLRPRLLRRTLGPDLLARLPVAPIAPVDALTVRRTVPTGSRRGAIARRPRPFARVATASARTVSSRRGNSARSSVSPHKLCTSNAAVALSPAPSSLRIRAASRRTRPS